MPELAATRRLPARLEALEEELELDVDDGEDEEEGPTDE